MSVGYPNSGRARRALMIGVIVTAVFMSNLDLWIVNVALVDIGRGLHSSLAGVSWVLNGYAVMLAALLIPLGRLGDRIGHRPVFLAGIAAFTLASLACALAPTLAVLIAARAVQAAGAAAQLPSSLALLMAAVPEPSRAGAARGWAAVGALSAVCGPVFGGLLVSLSWRWVFVVNLPIGILAWAIGRRTLSADAPRRGEPMPDLVGSGLLVVTVAALTGALVEAPDWGWTAGRTLGLVALTLAAATGFVRRCTRHARPAVELHLLRLRPFAVANAATIVFSAGFAIMLLSTSLWCQDVWHYSALRTGLAMAPGPGMVPPVTIASARLIRRLGPGRVAAAGSVLFAAAMLSLALTAHVRPGYLTSVLPSMLLGGVGVGLALSTLVAAGSTALPAHRAATGSAFVNSGRQVASALGVAILVTVLGTAAGPHEFRLAWVAAAVLAGCAAAISLGLPHAPAGAGPGRGAGPGHDRYRGGATRARRPSASSSDTGSTVSLPRT